MEKSLKRSSLYVLLPIGLLAIMGCSPEEYARQADLSVEEILPGMEQKVLGDREETVQYPKMKKEEAPSPEGEPREERKPADEKPTVLNLKETLGVAFQTNRGFITDKENLYLTTLNLVGTRHTFSPNLSAVLSHIFSDATGSSNDQVTSLGVGVSQNFTWGGSLDVTGDTQYQNNRDLTDPKTFSSSLGVTLSQPLLQGAGYEVAADSLIQAERNLVYEIREFELRRQDLAIDVARRYYDLVRRIRSLENREKNIKKQEFSRRKAEALFNVGKGNELDVLLARRSELASMNELNTERQGLEEALDEFKVFLGLPISAKLDIVPTEPEFIAVDYDIESSVEVAFKNRLDYLTREEQLEDSARQVRIAKNGLLPNLNLDFSYALSSETEASYFNQKMDQASYSAGLSLEIPLDRVQERNNFRRAQISHDQTLRSFDEFEDNFFIEIERAFRSLKRLEKNLELTRQQIADEEKSSRIAELRFERGEIRNRDLVEARDSLLEVQNNLIDQKVQYELARLELLKSLGILFIDDNGMWKE